jgi:hypothetical protein
MAQQREVNTFGENISAERENTERNDEAAPEGGG